MKENNIKFPNYFIDGWYYGNVDENYEGSKLMTHQGYGEFWRERKLTICCDIMLKEYCQRNNIQLINFSDL